MSSGIFKQSIRLLHILLYLQVSDLEYDCFYMQSKVLVASLWQDSLAKQEI